MKRPNVAQQNLRQRQPNSAWWRQALPTLVVLGLVVAARQLGLFQELELKMLDTLLQKRPAEATDERILIVAVTEADIQKLGTYPVPDRVLTELLLTLNELNPRAIGIDIYRDVAVEPGHAALVDTLQMLPNVVGIEKILGDSPVAPPPALPPEQVGFVDLPLDDDGFVRRLLLGTQGPTGEFHYSFALALAEMYLAAEGLFLENGQRDPMAMRFGETEFAQITPNAGGYVNADVGELQTLLNVRSGAAPFRQVAMGDVLAGTVEPSWVNDAVVLIGVTSLSAKDLINSGAVVSDNPGLIYGVEIHAHATSQLINAVIEGRPLLRPWPDAAEYLWIVLWGGVSMVLVRWITSPSWYLLGLGLTGLGIVAISYGLLLGGWWIPLVPTLLAFTVNGVVVSGFYLYDQALRSRIEERQRIIEQTYNAIHNGPLQTLALLLRDSGETLSWPEALPRLNQVNQDLRSIYEELLKSNKVPVVGHLPQYPPAEVDYFLHEQLCEVYTDTLQRDFPGFKSLGPRIISFEPLDTEGLSLDDHQALCRFLEEALCNVGKHAVKATRLEVISLATDQENLIKVRDNGQGQPAAGSSRLITGGRGTEQAKQLAQRLGGTFKRQIDASGTLCELRWPVRRPARHWFKLRFS